MTILPADEVVKEIPSWLVQAIESDWQADASLILSRKADPGNVSSTEQTVAEREELFSVNCAEVDRLRVIESSMKSGFKVSAGSCVIGSESGFVGSFDRAYAAAEGSDYIGTSRRRYCKEHSGQQLVCVSPGIIGDAGMTTRRAGSKQNLIAPHADRIGSGGFIDVGRSRPVDPIFFCILIAVISVML